MPNSRQLKAGAELMLIGVCLATMGAVAPSYNPCTPPHIVFSLSYYCMPPYLWYGRLLMAVGVVILLEGVRFRMR